MSRPMLALISVGFALLIVVVYWFIPRSGQGQTGPSDYELKMAAQKDTAQAVTSLGGHVTPKSFAQGNASAVDLSGAQITDKLIDELGKLGPVCELNLSKSTVTDDQLGKMTKLGIPTFVLKMDLSHTGITDAGLDQLDNMVVLSDMNLVGSKCTAAGVAKFRQRRNSAKNTRITRTSYKLN
jgi:hypothetical protein